MSRSSADPECALVRAAQEGNAGAFEKIVNLYNRRVYAIIYRMTSRHDVAEDLGQEAFVRFWRTLDRFDTRMPVFPFLRKIAVNLTLNHFAARSGKEQAAEPEQLDQGRSPIPRHEDPVEQATLAETREELAAAVAALSPERRTTLTLRVIEGMSYEDIAEAMGCSIGTVMSRLFRARADVKERLERTCARENTTEWQHGAAGTTESAPVPL